MRSASWVKNGLVHCDSRYAIRLSLYRLFAPRCAYLTSARPIRTKRAHAQVAELVDALASGASGLTAVKVRVLSWAPSHSTPSRVSWLRISPDQPFQAAAPPSRPQTTASPVCFAT